jgi:hypothetical protein
MQQSGRHAQEPEQQESGAPAASAVSHLLAGLVNTSAPKSTPFIV